MKLNLRSAIAALPFVTDSRKGLNYWAVNPTGRLSLDLAAGRHYAAMFIHLMRTFEAPHLLFFLTETWRERDLREDHIATGFIRELWDCVTAAPKDATMTLQIAALERIPDEVNAAILDLQFVQPKADGEPELRMLPPGRHFSDDCARGRYLGAKCALLMRKFPDCDLPLMLARRDRSKDAHAGDGIGVGFCQEIAEIVMALGAHGTQTLKAALPVFEETFA